jgi:hypothetical protein
MTNRRTAWPLLGLLALTTTGCGGGVWANVPQDPGPAAAACRREAADSPEYRRFGEEAGGNAANNEELRQQLLVLLPQIYERCMIRSGARPPGSVAPPDRVTF